MHLPNTVTDRILAHAARSLVPDRMPRQSLATSPLFSAADLHVLLAVCGTRPDVCPLLATTALNLLETTPTRHTALDVAARNGRIDVLDQWCLCGLPVGRSYTRPAGRVLDAATVAGQLSVLEYFRLRRYSNAKMMPHAPRSLVIATSPAVLDFWVDVLLKGFTPHHRIAMTNKELVKAIPLVRNRIRRNGSVECLQWWAAMVKDRFGGISFIPMEQRGTFLGLAGCRNHVQVVQWCMSGADDDRAEWWNALSVCPSIWRISVLACLPVPLVRELYVIPTAAPDHNHAYSQFSRRGRADLLQFWTEIHGLTTFAQVKETVRDGFYRFVIVSAGRAGHLKVLDWWHTQGLDPSVFANLVHNQPHMAALKTLDWCIREEDVPARPGDLLSYYSLINIFMTGRLDILQWMVQVLEMPYFVTAEAVDAASQAGQAAVLEWALQQCCSQTDDTSKKLPRTVAALKCTSVPVLQWWADNHKRDPTRVPFSPLDFPQALYFACTHGAVAALEWWFFVSTPWFGGATPDVSRATLMNTPVRYHASRGSATRDLLNWWRQSGIDPLPYSPEVVDIATKYREWKIVDWWARSGLPVTVSAATVERWRVPRNFENEKKARRWECAVRRWQNAFFMEGSVN